MPLTPNAVNHLRRAYRAIFRGRESAVTLYFQDGTTKTIPAIWRQQDLSDAEAQPPANPQAATVDAAFEVDLGAAPTTLGELQAAIAVCLSAQEPLEQYGAASRYIVLAVQPKGMVMPPDRAYVMLRKV